LLSAALYHRENSMCPVVTSKTQSWITTKRSNEVLGSSGLQEYDALKETIDSFLDATMPDTSKGQ